MTSGTQSHPQSPSQSRAENAGNGHAGADEFGVEALAPRDGDDRRGGLAPAGLLELCDEQTERADLVLRLNESSPFDLARRLLQGDKPSVHIEGDVQLAAEVNWLIDHVRWEPEEDLARLMGDAPAHQLCRVARGAAQALRQFVGARVSRGAVAPVSTSDDIDRTAA